MRNDVNDDPRNHNCSEVIHLQLHTAYYKDIFLFLQNHINLIAQHEEHNHIKPHPRLNAQLRRIHRPYKYERGGGLEHPQDEGGFFLRVSGSEPVTGHHSTGVPPPARGGEEEGPPRRGAGSGALLLPPPQSRKRLLSTARDCHLQQTHGVSQKGVPRQRVQGGGRGGVGGGGGGDWGGAHIVGHCLLFFYLLHPFLALFFFCDVHVGAHFLVSGFWFCGSEAFEL